MEKATCSVDGCGRTARTRELCGAHYQAALKRGTLKVRRNTTLAKRGRRVDNPLFYRWQSAKSQGRLCEGWSADFWAFADAVGNPDDDESRLYSVNKTQPIGPGNFRWAKRWTYDGRLTYNQEWYRTSPKGRRALYARYGLTDTDVEAMMAAQGGVCAICHKPETRKSRHASDTTTRLAVDHDEPRRMRRLFCVRGLLCSKCNVAIGGLGHDVDRLRSAIAYLEAAEKDFAARDANPSEGEP